MRPPHVHFAVFAPGERPDFAGDPLNARDRLLNGVGDPSARARLVVALENPPPDLEPGYRVASFDIVLGKTLPLKPGFPKWSSQLDDDGSKMHFSQQFGRNRLKAKVSS